MNRIITFLLVVGIMMSCTKSSVSRSVDAHACESFQEVDFDQLADKDGEMIKIEGYFNYQFEDVALYDGRWFRDQSTALSVDFDNKLKLVEADYIKMSGTNIEVIGVLDLKSRGHLNHYRGTIAVLCINP